MTHVTMSGRPGSGPALAAGLQVGRGPGGGDGGRGGREGGVAPPGAQAGPPVLAGLRLRTQPGRLAGPLAAHARRPGHAVAAAGAGPHIDRDRERERERAREREREREYTNTINATPGPQELLRRWPPKGAVAGAKGELRWLHEAKEQT